MKGSLFIVSTPIGNLEDITLRALRVLREVDIIACEDTRHILKILSYYGIKNKNLISFFEGNETRRIPKIIGYLMDGKDIALVSNAGTPGISDPGYRLIERAIREDIHLNIIPGPCAFISALVISGLPTDNFIFKGFLPRRPGRRKKELYTLIDSTATIVLYESPYRLKETLLDIRDVFGERKVVVVKELTKKFEYIWRGTVSRILGDISHNASIKGEYIILIEGMGRKRRSGYGKKDNNQSR